MNSMYQSQLLARVFSVSARSPHSGLSIPIHF